MSELLVEVERVSKRFCRGLKRALWYCLRDIGGELRGDRRPRELRRGEFWAVDDVSFQVRRGECLGLIGANGAGKSTTLKMLNGLIKPDRGRITMRGRVGALIELGTGFSPILTGRENIYNNAAVLGFTRREVDRKLDDIISFSELDADALQAPVQTYSSGMKVRLGFAVASQFSPDVLLIDEVLAVGDIGFRVKCFSRMRELLRRGTAVILVSHNTSDIVNMCSDAIWFRDGRVHDRGDPHRLTVEYEWRQIERSSAAARQATGVPGTAYLDPQGPLQFSSISLAGAPAGSRCDASYDQPLEFQLRVTCRRPCPTAVLNYGLRNSGQVLYFGERLSLDGTFLSPGEYVVKLVIPPRSLLPGVHVLSVGLALDKRMGQYLHYVPFAVLVRVAGPWVNRRHGCVLLEPRVAVDRAPSPSLTGAADAN